MSAIKSESTWKFQLVSPWADTGGSGVVIATKGGSGTLVSYADIQAVIGKDCSKRFRLSHPNDWCAMVVPKDTALGTMTSGGRMWSFITVALAKAMLCDRKYAIIGAQTYCDTLDRVTVPSAVTEAAEEPGQGKAEDPAQGKAEDPRAKWAEEQARGPESVLDDPEVRAAVDAARDVGFPRICFSASVALSNGHRHVLSTMLHFAGPYPLPVIVAEDPATAKRAAYVDFQAVCQSIGLDPEKSLMSLSRLMNTAALGGVSLIRVASGDSSSPWIAVESVYAWLAQAPLIVFAPERVRKKIDVFQVGLKEAVMKVYGREIRNVEIPKAADNAAGRKPPHSAGDARNESGAAEAGAGADAEAQAWKQAEEEAGKVRKEPSQKAKTADEVPSSEPVDVPAHAEMPLPPNEGPEDADDSDLIDQLGGMLETSRDRSEWKTVNFDGFSVAVTEFGNDKWVSIARICNDLGIDKSSQLAKLKGDRTFNRGVITTVGRDGKVRPHICLPTSELYRWLEGIQKSCPEAAERIAMYKATLMDVLLEKAVEMKTEQQCRMPAVDDRIGKLLERCSCVLAANERLQAEQKALAGQLDTAVDLAEQQYEALAEDARLGREIKDSKVLVDASFIAADLGITPNRFNADLHRWGVLRKVEAPLGLTGSHWALTARYVGERLGKVVSLKIPASGEVQKMWWLPPQERQRSRFVPLWMWYREAVARVKELYTGFLVAEQELKPACAPALEAYRTACPGDCGAPVADQKPGAQPGLGFDEVTEGGMPE